MMKKFERLFVLLVILCTLISPISVSAASLDSLSGRDGTTNSTGGGGDETDSAMKDYLENYEAVTGDNMQKASTFASPIASMIGTLVGVIMIITSAGIFLVTALDLMYIGLPFTREFLAPGVQGDSASGGAMGGMGMGGMGMRGMGMRGMGGGGGVEQRVWVSDEAIQAVRGAQGNPQQGGAMGGMGMMGGMGGTQMQTQQSQGGGKSAITTYLIKRSFFLIVFAVCSVILLSSILTDCGLNLAELLMKILGKSNEALGNVQIN